MKNTDGIIFFKNQHKLMSEILASFSSNSSDHKMSKTMGKVLNVLDTAYLELKKDRHQNPNNDYLKRFSYFFQPCSLKDELCYLIRGYIVKKHSKKTSKPTLKFLYICEDLRFLCWKSTDKQDEKKMEINEITHIAYGEDSINFIKSQTIQNPQNCIVIVGRNRSLEIECSNVEECFKIGQELTLASDQSKRMRYSYRI